MAKTSEERELDEFLTWSNSRLVEEIGTRANQEFDANLAAIREAAAISPFRVENELREQVANDIWIAMSNVGLSQADLARRLGKSRAYVSKLLAGGQNLTLESLAQIGQALDCDVAIKIKSSTERPRNANSIAQSESVGAKKANSLPKKSGPVTEPVAAKTKRGSSTPGRPMKHTRIRV